MQDPITATRVCTHFRGLRVDSEAQTGFVWLLSSARRPAHRQLSHKSAVLHIKVSDHNFPIFVCTADSSAAELDELPVLQRENFG